METLMNLINQARKLVSETDTLDVEDIVIHNGHQWVMDGGRACPLGWGDCSQSVFRIADTTIYDYGETGGIGDIHCKTNCPHGYEIPPVEEETLPIEYTPSKYVEGYDTITIRGI